LVKPVLLVERLSLVLLEALKVVQLVETAQAVVLKFEPLEFAETAQAVAALEVVVEVVEVVETAQAVVLELELLEVVETAQAVVEVVPQVFVPLETVELEFLGFELFVLFEENRLFHPFFLTSFKI